MSLATRVVRGICLATAYPTALAALLGWAAFLIHPLRPVLVSVGGWVLIAPMLLALTSAWMQVTWLLADSQEMSVSALSLAYYVPYCVVGMEVAWWVRVSALAGLTLFHFVSQVYVPAVVALRRGWRPEGGAAALYWPLNKLYTRPQ